MLLRAGAAAGVLCAGKSALEAARKNGHTAVVALLEALPQERLVARAAPAAAAQTNDAASDADDAVKDDADDAMTFLSLSGSVAEAGLAPPGGGADSDEELLEGVAPEDH